MKISKKLKWSLGLVGLTAMTVVPMSVALSSCSSGSSDNNDNNSANGGVVDENGIIQPLSKSDITPTQFNFDNRLTSNTAEIKQVNSLEEANQILNDKWNVLSDEQKIACIKNDIQNWYNYINLNCSGSATASSGNIEDPNESLCINFVPPKNDIPTFVDYDDTDYTNLKYRGFLIQNLSTIVANNNYFNITISGSQILQYLINDSAIVNSQMKMNQSLIISDINISCKLLQYQNKIFSGIIITPNSFSKGISTLESCTNWITNESTPINEYTKKIYNEMIGKPYEENFNKVLIFPSPYLNMIFEINNIDQN